MVVDKSACFVVRLTQFRKLQPRGEIMNSKTFQELGISFYSNSDLKRYVPHVDAVLFVLGLGEKDSGNPLLQMGPVYTVNVHRAAVAASFEVKARWVQHPGYLVAMRRIIARTIVGLCLEDARCLLNRAFLEAKWWAGDNVPSQGTSEDALIDACTCPEHRKFKQDRAKSTD